MRAIILTLSLLLFSVAAQAATVVVLDPGSTYDYMQNWCGGTALNEIASGFDTNHNPVVIVTDQTRCSSGGRGSKSRIFFTCYRVTFQNGIIITRERLVYASWLQGSPSVPCPVQADPNAQYEDGDMTLTTTTVYGGPSSPQLYRAVLTTP